MHVFSLSIDWHRSGAAQTDEEAGRVCEALAHAGIVLRFGDCVFLRPQDVVEIMMRVSHPSASGVLVCISSISLTRSRQAPDHSCRQHDRVLQILNCSPSSV